MAYRVRLTPEAEADIEELYRWLIAPTPLRGPAWFNGMMDAIESLASHPQRCPLAPETAFFPKEIRQLLYGRGRGVHRILFTIKGATVVVLHVRHGARTHLTE
jgi:plasmid stabilization system protein ParE